MKRKLLSVIIVTSVAISMVACGGKNKEKISDTDKEGVTAINEDSDVEETVEENSEKATEETTDVYEAKGVILYEKNLYDDEMANSVSKLQGKIKDYYLDGVIPSVLVENGVYRLHSWYINDPISSDLDVTTYREITTFEIGNCVLLSHQNNRISLYQAHDRDTDMVFRDVPYNENDYLFEIEGSGRFSILRIEDGNCKFFMYFTEESYIEDNYDTYKEQYGDAMYEIINSFGEKFVVIEETVSNITAKISNGDSINISNARILAEESNSGSGYKVHCITANNELYEIKDCKNGIFELETTDPIDVEVESIYHSSGLLPRMIVPIYSKYNDNKHLYTKVYGESASDSADDKVVTFEMPEAYTIADIKKLRSGEDIIFVEFNSGDIYMTDVIDTNAEKIYTLTKIDELSSLNENGEILEFSGNYEEHEIYLLMDNNKLYVYKY